MINQAEITIKKTSDLVLWDKNPRQISDKNFIKLKKQIEKLGVYKPLLINQDNIVIGGNMRLRALMDLGVTEVACSNVKTKDETEMIEYALSDNDRAGDYDQQQLAELIYNVPIDLELYHIDVGKTYKLKDVLSQFTEDGEVPEVETDEDNIKSKKGEVYLLGEHRVMCGSSDDPADVAILMNGKKARMIFTDPPYMVDYKSPGGGSYNSGKYKHHDGKIFNDNLKEAEALEFYKKVAQNLYDFSTDDSCIYWWYASRNQHFNREALMGGGWHISQIIIWVKNGLVLSRGQLFHRAYEPCMVGWKKGKTSYKNKLVTNIKDIWNLQINDFAELADVWYQHRDNMADYEHPTQRPTGLAVRGLKRSSQIGDLVLDLFGGSGSTLVACEQNNRVCYTMELDPAYCDVIRKRYAILKEHRDDWEDYTKKEN